MKPEIAAQLAAPAFAFTVHLSSTRRGARLARRLAVQQLADWGIPYAGRTSSTVAAVTAELAANAVSHAARPAGTSNCAYSCSQEWSVSRSPTLAPSGYRW
jgi:anti-sigma regulatory factor (Ser/Thr protein kinase)